MSAGFSVLLIVLIVLATRFALDWAAISSGSADALASKQVEVKAMEMQTAPLRGLDKRVAETRDQIKTFYADRIPANYSSFATRIGELEVKSGVRLTRIGYTQGKPGPDLTEIFSRRQPHRRLLADHALHQLAGARQDLFRGEADESHRPAGRRGEPAASGFHLDAQCRRRGQPLPQANTSQPPANSPARARAGRQAAGAEGE